MTTGIFLCLINAYWGYTETDTDQYLSALLFLKGGLSPLIQPYPIQNRFTEDLQCTGSGILKINKIQSFPSKGLKPYRETDTLKVLSEIAVLPQKKHREVRRSLKPNWRITLWITCADPVLCTCLTLCSPHSGLPISLVLLLNWFFWSGLPGSEMLSGLLNLTKQVADIKFKQPRLTTKTMHLLIKLYCLSTAIYRV